MRFPGQDHRCAARGGRRLSLLLVYLMTGAGFCGTVLAQEPTVKATVDRTRIRLGDRLTLTIEVLGDPSGRSSTPDLSRIEDFDVVGGPSVSTRFQWIIGRSSSSKSYKYALRPRRLFRVGLIVQPPRLAVKAGPGRLQVRGP